MNIDPSAAISGVIQLISGWRERLSADRRHLKDLALKAAIVQWEYNVAEVKFANSNLPMGKTPEGFPRSILI